VQFAKQTDLFHQGGIKITFKIAGQIHSYSWQCWGGYATLREHRTKCGPSFAEQGGWRDHLY